MLHTEPQVLEPFAHIRPLSISEIQNRPPRDYLIKGLLREDEMSVWYGTPGCGKSFLLLDTARCIATGEEWFGRKTSQHPVLYVMSEGIGAVGNRMSAMQLEHSLYENSPIHIIPTAPRLLEHTEDIDGLVYWAKKLHARLVVIDTLNRVMAGGDENSSADMGRFIKCCDRIRNEANAHVAVVHHNGANKGKRGRGHSSLEGAADAMVEVQNVGRSKIAKVTKNKDDEENWHVSFDLQIVEINTDRDGDSVTSCVVVPADAQGNVLSHGLPENSQMLIDTFKSIQNKVGKVRGPQDGVPENMVTVTKDELRSCFLSRKDGKHESKCKAFNRSISNLLNSGRLGHYNGLIWENRT